MAEFYVQLSEEETSDGIVFESEEYQAMVDGGTLTLDPYKAAFDQHGWRYYHAWGGAPGPENIYVVDPTGDSIQLDGAWTGGAPAGVAGDAR